MTQEEKAKRYDKVIKIANEYYNSPRTCIDINVLTELFPELRESEDEKIRKALIKSFEIHDLRALIIPGFSAKDVIAWLEKQGERQTPQNNERAWLYLVADVLTWSEGIGQYLDNPNVKELAKKLQKEYGQKLYIEEQGNTMDINPSEFDLRLNKLLKQFETLPKEELASSLSFYLNVVQNDGTYKADEKQGEQKPADKVEPKFKVGDWIVQENIGVYKVIEVCESWYEVIDIEDNHYSISFDKEYMCHLWTIQDTKDGDVLVSELCDSIILFKGINDDNNIDFYCDYYFSEIDVPGDRFSVNNGQHYGNVEDSEDFHPATKEQRDTLEKAMADAGYTFDFEKKELEKL